MSRPLCRHSGKEGKKIKEYIKHQLDEDDAPILAPLSPFLGKALHIVIEVGPLQALKINICLDLLPQFVSIHPRGSVGGLGGRDGWIRVVKVRLISFGMIRVDFFDLLRWFFSTSEQGAKSYGGEATGFEGAVRVVNRLT